MEPFRRLTWSAETSLFLTGVHGVGVESFTGKCRASTKATASLGGYEYRFGVQSSLLHLLAVRLDNFLNLCKSLSASVRPGIPIVC